MTIDKVTAALTTWGAADVELKRVEKVTQGALDTGSDGVLIQELTRQLAGLRADRERAYRAALAAMQAHHDRTEA